MSHSMTKPTKWPVCPAKTQISLGICPDWLVFSVRMKKPRVFSYPSSTQRKLWSTMPSLIWVFAGCTWHFVGFVVLWLISWCLTLKYGHIFINGAQLEWECVKYWWAKIIIIWLTSRQYCHNMSLASFLPFHICSSYINFRQKRAWVFQCFTSYK